jgi:hypothetical protein
MRYLLIPNAINNFLFKLRQSSRKSTIAIAAVLGEYSSDSDRSIGEAFTRLNRKLFVAFGIICILGLCSFLHAYQDEELQRLWASIADINQPTIEDYQHVQIYLSQGRRPYLEDLRQSAFQMDQNTRRRLDNILNFKLIGKNGEMPVFEIHHLNVKETTKNRCILLFASFNGLYEEKIRRVLENLKVCGYSGDVLLRIGGFPNLQKGGLKMCHIPYAFKAAFFQEARERGYKEILWLDTCMHPLDHLEKIFAKIRNQGYFFSYAGVLQDNALKHLPKAAGALDIGSERYDQIFHVSSGILGLHMESGSSQALLDGWLAETEKIWPNVTWFPEELSLSVVAWRCNLRPDCWLGSVMCGENELKWLAPLRPALQFYCEDTR